MADKKEPAAGWPVISGDYIVGDPESPVAVTSPLAIPVTIRHATFNISIFSLRHNDFLQP